LPNLTNLFTISIPFRTYAKSEYEPITIALNFLGLLSLLKWKSEPERLARNLQIFNQKVNGHEFVKFMPDVLDALFTILVK